MKIAFFAPASNLQKIKDKIEQDPVGRSSIYYKANTALGLPNNGMYIIIDGSDENCKLAKEWMAGLGEEVLGADLETLLKKFEESEMQAMEGFGGIFS